VIYMKAGKLPPEKLQSLVLGRFSHRRADVLVPARLGEDSAIIDFGDVVCVISTDPITGAASGAGRLAVHVSCNDVAANGAEPVGVQVVLLLPVNTCEKDIARLMDEIEAGCRELGIEVLGGHTEITSKVNDPVIITTAIGRAARSEYVTSSNCRVGDDVVVTKGIGLEGTAILATDWGYLIEQKAQEKNLRPPATDWLEKARSFADEVSAVRDGMLAARYGVSAMHDVTEGGLYGGLYELGQASEVAFRIETSLLPVRAETAFICAALGLDPLGLISSGSMLICCPNGKGLVQRLSNAGIPAFVIGKAVAGKESYLVDTHGNSTVLPLLAEDELWRFLATITK